MGLIATWRGLSDLLWGVLPCPRLRRPGRLTARVSGKGCTVVLFQRICRFLFMRLSTALPTALSTNVAEIGMPRQGGRSATFCAVFSKIKVLQRIIVFTQLSKCRSCRRVIISGTLVCPNCGQRKPDVIKSTSSLFSSIAITSIIFILFLDILFSLEKPFLFSVINIVLGFMERFFH